jgi:hypothetical protein
MVELLGVVALLALVGCGYLAYRVIGLSYEARLEKTAAEESAWRFVEANKQVERLRREMFEERERLRDFEQRRTRDFDRRVAELLRQNQNLAEKLATLSLEEGVTVGERTEHVEEVAPREPFPQAVRGFLDKIENPSARELVEEQIYRLRDVENKDWHDVLAEIRVGGAV